jgi:hypothetical protein
LNNAFPLEAEQRTVARTGVLLEPLQLHGACIEAAVGCGVDHDRIRQILRNPPLKVCTVASRSAASIAGMFRPPRWPRARCVDCQLADALLLCELLAKADP